MDSSPLASQGSRRDSGAVQAMVRERLRRRKEGAPHDVMVAVELDIVAFFIEYLGLELQSGHTEQAIACMQAALEYNFFCPDFEGKLRPCTIFCICLVTVLSVDCSRQQAPCLSQISILSLA